MSIRTRLRRLGQLSPSEPPPSWWDGLYVPLGGAERRMSLEELNAICPVEFVIWRAGLGEEVSLEEAQRRIAAGERCPPTTGNTGEGEPT